MKTILNRNFVDKTLCLNLFAISCEEFMAMQKIRQVIKRGWRTSG